MKTPSVSVMEIKCPIHGRTVVGRANQGAMDLACGCSWAQRGEPVSAWECFYYSRGWQLLEKEAAEAGFLDLPEVG